MTANTNFLIHELSANALVFERLFEVHEAKQALWKPDKDKWCLLEIVCHLVDEEVLDFRTRVKTSLYPDQYDFVPIDPVGWVTSRNYIEQDYQERTQTWLNERQQSIAWLRSLDSPDWKSCLAHPELGEMSAWQFLENWVAHDYIHLRQIIRTKRAYLNHLAQEDLSYAGKW
ncbi:DinB family protein [Roseivirga sp. E12]|uniref:DinB family protein n=1 Tax=Roseivirga sp. E12 TaxID=2819237 RepID=UPI001ABBE8A3|nr:DinB family protein [Roseivirga sp. E12]MBO3698126.1 DinB family protein [Roseivirga sp. E12]